MIYAWHTRKSTVCWSLQKEPICHLFMGTKTISCLDGISPEHIPGAVHAADAQGLLSLFWCHHVPVPFDFKGEAPQGHLLRWHLLIVPELVQHLA